MVEKSETKFLNFGPTLNQQVWYIDSLFTLQNVAKSNLKRFARAGTLGVSGISLDLTFTSPHEYLMIKRKQK